MCSATSCSRSRTAEARCRSRRADCPRLQRRRRPRRIAPRRSCSIAPVRSSASTDASGSNIFSSYTARGETAKQWQVVTNPGSPGVSETLVTIYQYDKLGRADRDDLTAEAHQLDHHRQDHQRHRVQRIRREDLPGRDGRLGQPGSPGVFRLRPGRARVAHQFRRRNQQGLSIQHGGAGHGRAAQPDRRSEVVGVYELGGRGRPRRPHAHRDALRHSRQRRRAAPADLDHQQWPRAGHDQRADRIDRWHQLRLLDGERGPAGWREVRIPRRRQQFDLDDGAHLGSADRLAGCEG